jgi:plasmid stability protein
MAQLLVRNLEEAVKRRLKKRAETHGRSLEGEVREILRSAVDAANIPDQKNFGTRFASYFADIGVDLEPMPVEFMKPIDFE